MISQAMRYLALCCDYDGTLATHGSVAPETFGALERLRASGRRVLLVTGRELDDLAGVCPRLELFTYIVAENGALLYEPATRTATALAPPPPKSFVAALHQRGVTPLSVGRVIVATWEPCEATVLEVIRELGLELQVIFNKGAVMVLPAGVSKATGLAAALKKMGLSAHNTVGVGDAENDHTLLAACEYGAAVANALPALKARADRVTAGAHGAGVVELCEELLRDDLATQGPPRHHLLLGRDAAGREIRVAPYGERVLVLGALERGRTVAEALLEQLSAQAYSFCVITPEARRTFSSVLCLGEPDRAPGVDELLYVLKDECGDHVLVSLAGLQPPARPAFLSRLARRLAQLRAVSGKPHWLLIDAADQLLTADAAVTGLEDAHTAVYTALHPSMLSRDVLSATTLLVASGATPHVSIEEFCRAAALPVPAMEKGTGATALAWRPAGGAAPRAMPGVAAAPARR
jgi:HAD superfamily hydrolase (TIGR01484 family)